MTMIKIASANILSNKDYERIKNNSAHGARGVIYRLLFNNFYNKGYFRRIRITDFFNRGIEASSPSRLILTYMANSTDVELAHDTRVIPFDELLNVINGEIDDKDVIYCLWEMYNLITADDWCNLISFAESSEASENGLYKEYDNYLKRKNKESFQNINYSKFRITTAGIAFLTYACIHFEFFACRSLSAKYPPLFLPKAFEKIEDKYFFEKIIEAVLNEVKTCAQMLKTSYESDCGLCSVANSPFVFKRPERSSQYHIERIAFSHVTYLDEFRRFALKTKDSALAEYTSNFILNKIEEYLNILINGDARCSEYGKVNILKTLVELLDEAKKDPYNPEKIIGRKNEYYE